MPRLRVVQVTPDLELAGLQRVVATICRGLDPARFESAVICLRGGGPLADDLRALGMRVDVVGEPDVPDHLAFAKVRRVLGELRPDVVHTHNTMAFVDGAVAVALMPPWRRPRLVHTDHARNYPDKWRYMFAERVVSRLASHVVAVSDHTRDDLVTHVGIAPRKIVTVPNGIDDVPPVPRERLDAMRRELGIPEESLVIGTGARLVPQKGFEYLLAAMPAVLREVPGTVLLVVGEGPLEPELRATAERLGVASQVRFTGSRRDLPALLQLYDVFALPSVWEGLPMVILEAFATSRAVVASDVGGVPTAVHDGQTGLLVPARDVAALGAALARVLRDAALRARLGAAGRALYLEQFSSPAMVRAYERLYTGARG